MVKLVRRKVAPTAVAIPVRETTTCQTTSRGRRGRVAAGRCWPLLDRMEQKGAEFHRRVRAGYLQQARERPDRHLVVDASKDPDAVFAQVIAGVTAHWPR